MTSTSLVGFGPSSSLSSLGYHSSFAAALAALTAELPGMSLVPARVVAQLGEQVRLAGAASEWGAPSGRLRHQAAPLELPIIGDWVAIAEGAGGEPAVIHRVLPRTSLLLRRAAGRRGEPQAVAANVDTYVVVTSANRDANPRRLERYLAAVRDSGARPVLVLNKSDLVEPAQLAAVEAELAGAAPGVPIFAVSAATRAGLGPLLARLAADAEPGQVPTLAFIGMSGVGKSSLINALLGAAQQHTLPINQDDRGRHATTRRELFVLPSGLVVIDTPGMRELGLVDDDGGLAAGFAEISELAEACRFADCRHQGEPGCAVAAAIERGEVAPARLAALHKLEREVHAARVRREPGAAQRSKQRTKAIHVAQRARRKVDPKLRD